jgi:monofunctional glycosyltransferase
MAIIPRWRAMALWKKLLLILAATPLLLTLLYLLLPPVSTPMLARWLTGQSVERRYVRLSEISPALIVAVLTAEDARFCAHWGVDFGALSEVIEGTDEDGPARGASTIAMQSAKNLFLWNSRSYLRKGLEIPLALQLDLILSKRRLLEIYLNIAEWGEGVYGIEAAARHYFRKPAKLLDRREAVLLAAALPLPRQRNPVRPTGRQMAIASTLNARMSSQTLDLSCLALR